MRETPDSETDGRHTRRAWSHAKGDVLAFQQLTLPDKCDECDVIWPCAAVLDPSTPAPTTPDAS